MGILRAVELSKSYSQNNLKRFILDQISFTLRRGEFVGLMGTSGSGKTTLLNVLSTIDKPDKGELWLNDTQIVGLRDNELALLREKEISFIFQDYNLIDTMTVFENITLSLMVKKQNMKEMEKEVTAICKMLGIDDSLNKLPYELSGGERQRCACARALIKKSSLIFADEPTGALDSKAANVLLTKFVEMSKSFNKTIFMVTHDAAAASYCDRVMILEDGHLDKTLERDERTRKHFYNEILATVSPFKEEEE